VAISALYLRDLLDFGFNAIAAAVNRNNAGRKLKRNRQTRRKIKLYACDAQATLRPAPLTGLRSRWSSSAFTETEAIQEIGAAFVKGAHRKEGAVIEEQAA
jgi:hypothetical protein